MSGEDLILGSQMAIFLLCPHVVKRARDVFGISFIRLLTPFMKALSS